MNHSSIVFVSLDTHKTFCEVAYIEDQPRIDPVHDGRIATTKAALKKLVRQFESRFPGATLHFIYEAGPCGYWIYRLITSLGHPCYVIAPSLTPKKPGERVKTDRRDALKLAKHAKNGDLTPIYVPEPEDEAVRDLSRARESAMRDLNKARYQLKAFLLRNNIRSEVEDNWSAKHLRWLTELVLPHPAQQIVLQEYLQTLRERLERLERLDNELSHQVKQWRYYPLVQAYQAMRGVALVVAAGVVAELGDLTRFDHPSKLMSYVGLVPSEDTSSDRRKLGPITKCGNHRVRRLLVESAHSYRYPANVTTELQKRQEGLPKAICDIAWQAQLRLCRRFQRLIKRGKLHNVVKVAIARELLGFMWSIARIVPLQPVNPKERISRVPR